MAEFCGRGKFAYGGNAPSSFEFDSHAAASLARAPRRLPALKDLSQTLLQKICYKFKKRRFSKREAIYTEGSLAKAVFLVYRGEVRVSKKITVLDKPQLQFPSSSVLRHKTRSKTLELAAIGPGELFGEEDLVEGQDLRSTSCVAYTDVWLYSLSKEFFFKLLMNHEEAEILKCKAMAKQEARRSLVLQYEQLLSLKTSPVAAVKPVRKPALPFSPMQALKTLSNLPKLGSVSRLVPARKERRSLQLAKRPLGEYLGEKPQTPKKQERPCVNIHVHRLKNHRSTRSCGFP